MEVKKIFLIAVLFATLFFGKSLIFTAVPSVAENFAVRENAGAKYFKSAVEEQNAKNYDKAIGLYNKAISAENLDNDSCSYNSIGKIFEEMNEPKKALAQYWKAIENYPDDAEAYQNFGKLFKDTLKS